MQLEKCLTGQCADVLSILGTTLLSMVWAPKEEKVKFQNFGVFFFTTLSVVSLIYLSVKFGGIPVLLAISMSFMAGRWCRKVEKKIMQLVDEITLGMFFGNKKNKKGK